MLGREGEAAYSHAWSLGEAEEELENDAKALSFFAMFGTISPLFYSPSLGFVCVLCCNCIV